MSLQNMNDLKIYFSLTLEEVRRENGVKPYLSDHSIIVGEVNN